MHGQEKFGCVPWSIADLYKSWDCIQKRSPKKKGKYKVFAYAQSGIYRKVQVTVK